MILILPIWHEYTQLMRVRLQWCRSDTLMRMGRYVQLRKKVKSRGLDTEINIRALLDLERVFTSSQRENSGFMRLLSDDISRSLIHFLVIPEVKKISFCEIVCNGMT